jgi:predicted exporter
VTRREALTLALFGLTLLAAAIHVARSLQVTTGLTAFVAGTDDPVLADVAARLADSSVARTLILSVGAPELSIAIDAARRWEERLRTHPEVAAVVAGPPSDIAEQAQALFYPHRLALLSSDPERELTERLSDAGLARAAAELREALQLPDGVIAQRTAAADPLQAFAAQLRRLEGVASGGAQVAQGRFVSRDRTRAILFVTTRHSALDASHQGPFSRTSTPASARSRAAPTCHSHSSAAACTASR